MKREQAMDIHVDLRDRISELLGTQPGLTTAHWLGGLVFREHGNICCGVIDDQLLVRVGHDSYEEVLARPHAGPLNVDGRPMPGYVLVTPAGYADDERLAEWLDRSLCTINPQAPSAPTVSPWLGIMLQPRPTIRALVAKDSVRTSVWIVVLWGALTADVDLGECNWLIERVVGGLLGLAGMYILAAIFRFTGRLLDGQATFGEVLTVLGFSMLPTVYAAIFDLGVGFLSYLISEAFSATAPWLPSLNMLLFGFGIGLTVLAVIWGLVLQVICFAEVSRFSVWRSIAALFIVPIILFFGAMTIIMLLMSPLS